MVLGAFYSTVSTLSFVLLGLWWVVAERHQEWFRHPSRRRMAYAVSLHFMLPGLMSLLSLIAPQITLVWRVVFTLTGFAGVVGAIMAAGAVAEEYGRVRLAAVLVWVALPVYMLLILIAIAPALAEATGLAPRQLEGFLLVGVILLGLHAAWFFGTEPVRASDRDTAPGKATALGGDPASSEGAGPEGEQGPQAET